MIGASAMSRYYLEHLYTNSLKQNAVNINGKTTIFLAQVVAHTAKREREKEGKKERRGKKIETVGGRKGRMTEIKKKDPPYHPPTLTPGTESFFRKSLPTTEGTPILLNPKVHYCIHRNQNSSPTLSQISTAHVHAYYF
jgi:hypothetical protein